MSTSTNSQPPSSQISQSVHHISDLIYEIKEKITDQEYMDLMNSITSLKQKKECDTWYTFTIMIPTLDTRIQFCHDYQTFTDSFNFMESKLSPRILKVNSRVIPCSLRKNLTQNDYCYSCKDATNRETDDYDGCSHIYSLRDYVEELTDSNKPIIYPNTDVSLYSLANGLYDVKDILMYLSSRQKREVNTIQVENRDRYNYGRKKRKRDSYDSRVKCSTMNVDYKCVLYSVEKM